MKGINVLFFSLILVFSCADARSAIYKCFDELGRPVYSATPTCVAPKEMNKISKKFQKKKKNDEKIDKEEQEKQNRKEQCESARVQLKKYERAPFLTKMIKDKEGREVKVRLTKEEAGDVILDAKKEVSYWCDAKEDK